MYHILLLIQTQRAKEFSDVFQGIEKVSRSEGSVLLGLVHPSVTCPLCKIAMQPRVGHMKSTKAQFPKTFVLGVVQPIDTYVFFMHRKRSVLPNCCGL